MEESAEKEQVILITIEEQFYEFARMLDQREDGSTMTLYCSDFWLRQANIIDDRTITMTDTGILWWKFCKTELNKQEWGEFLEDLCSSKNLDRDQVELNLRSCGLPGIVPVHVPQYRVFFDTYISKKKLIVTEDID